MNGDFRNDYIKPARHEGIPLIGAPEKPKIKFGGDTKLMAKKSCKRCYGRGYIGFNISAGWYEACSCVREFPVAIEKNITNIIEVNI